MPRMAFHGEIGLDRGLMDASIVCAIGVALSLKWTACASQLRDPFLVGGDVAYADAELLTRVRLSPSRAPPPVAPPSPGRSPAARCLLDPSNSRDGPLPSIPPPQISAPCALEAISTLVAAVVILVSRNPLRGVGAILGRGARCAARALMPRAVASFLDRALGYSYAPCADSEEGPDARRPRMTPALDALVTDADVADFLTELERVPTEFQAAEEMAASRAGTSQEVTSGLGGYRASTLDDEVDSAGPHPGASDWTVLQRGSTGNGTTFRLLRRNGPAPGTADARGRGLTQFRIEMVMQGVTAAQLARVQMNDVIRGQWDASLLHADHLAATEAEPAPGKTPGGEGTELALWRMKFPMPLQPRDYLFVRRRWETSDGTLYGVTKDATGCRDGDELAASAGLGGGGYRVRRIFSGQRIRNVRLEGEDAAQCSAEASPAQSTTSSSTSFFSPGRGGRGAPAAELVSIYHEDSGVPAAVISLGACKGLMPYMRNLEEAARSGRFVEGNVVFRQKSTRVRRRLFGSKDSGAAKRSFWPIKRFSLARGDAAARWFPHKAGFSGENSVRVGRFGFRHGTKKALSRLKQGIHRTVHRAAGHDHVHAEGRRRRLMVRAAGLVAVMARMSRNR